MRNVVLSNCACAMQCCPYGPCTQQHTQDTGRKPAKMERVQVVVRVKPGADSVFGPAEALPDATAGYKLTMKAHEDLQQEDAWARPRGEKRQSDGIFEVDDVLEGRMSQQEVWQCFEEPIMRRVFHPETGEAHFGVTLMAYGQTGSGKTFTMMGPEECKLQPLGPDGNIVPDAGICLRLCNSLFQRIESNRAERGVKTTVSVGLLELYDEKLFDLLNKRVPVKLGQNRAGYFPMEQQLRQASSLQQVAAVLVEGYGNVTLGATAMNEVRVSE